MNGDENQEGIVVPKRGVLRAVYRCLAANCRLQVGCADLEHFLAHLFLSHGFKISDLRHMHGGDCCGGLANVAVDSFNQLPAATKVDTTMDLSKEIPEKMELICCKKCFKKEILPTFRTAVKSIVLEGKSQHGVVDISRITWFSLKRFEAQ
jgi:hypothetical protein